MGYWDNKYDWGEQSPWQSWVTQQAQRGNQSPWVQMDPRIQQQRQQGVRFPQEQQQAREVRSSIGPMPMNPYGTGRAALPPVRRQNNGGTISFTDNPVFAAQAGLKREYSIPKLGTGAERQQTAFTNYRGM